MIRELSALLLCLSGCIATSAATVNVVTYGATGDGIHDDTPAIQAAINALTNQGGGTLIVPVGTYLLNSYSPSPHPWYFYNLRIGTSIHIQGTPGATFLQGPNGRAPLQPGASEVRNSVLAVGSPYYVADTFSAPEFNGGFYSLAPTQANSMSVTLSSQSSAPHFHVGDLVAIYSSIPVNGLIPSEISQVTSVGPAGVLGLAHPLARAFSTPSIANVTNLATVDVAVNNLVIQGTEPLAINEVFAFAATGCTFISTTSVTGGNTHGLNMNEIRGFSFTNNVVTYSGPNYIQELPQNNSQDVTLIGNTFNVMGIGFGEYGAHWTIMQNTFLLQPNALQGPALSFGGLDVLFSNNLVQGTTIGSAPLITDWAGTDSYAAYVGQIRINNNTINCNSVALADCMDILAPDTQVNENTITASGATQNAILVQGPLPQTGIQIQWNKITLEHGGIAVVLNAFGKDSSNISCNNISGSGLMGIFVPSAQSTPSSGADTIVGNIVAGFGQNINVNSFLHPNTLVDNTTGTCPPGY